MGLGLFAEYAIPIAIGIGFTHVISISNKEFVITLR